jgi:hypothetical protein
MSDPELTPIEALAAIVQSDTFATVKAAVEALDPTIMLEPAVAPHLKAFATGMNALAAAPVLQPAAPEPPAE